MDAETFVKRSIRSECPLFPKADFSIDANTIEFPILSRVSILFQKLRNRLSIPTSVGTKKSLQC